ncbi:protein kinase [Fervidibacillus albus]|uniref:Protein kinase n=1 Tax=Fervidibacillus albus TaxID=2980026 RepID=A0A9E8LVD0_9BACI|nr:protein kinase [Fervidibacillus albus]WAA10279.1 protein kinase [Fervidibacillus albus]
MYEVKYDQGKNRIYITLEGNMSLQEIDSYVSAVKKATDEAQPNFTVCLDGSKAAPFAPDVDKKSVEARDYLMKNGLKGLATIVDSAILKMHVNRTLKEMGNNVFATQAEADKYLDSL